MKESAATPPLRSALRSLGRSLQAGLLFGALLFAGCGELGVLVLHFEQVPASATEIRIRTRLFIRSSPDWQPQEEVVAAGDLSSPLGLRFPAENLIQISVSAFSLSGENGPCLGAASGDVVFPGRGRRDLTLAFDDGTGCAAR